MTKHGLALYDLHYPSHHGELLKNFIKYVLSRKKWDYLVLGGDTLDLACISHYSLSNNNQRELEGKRLISDFRGLSAYLYELSKQFKDIYFLVGNHSEWVEKFIDKYPMLEGLLELENNLPFKELGIKVIQPRHFAKIGSLYFIHGDVFSGYAPVFHSKRVVELYNRNIVYGHGHNYQSYIKCSPVDIADKHMGISMPCMADLSQFKYAKNRPSNWVNGFGVFHVNGKKFSMLPIISVDGSFISPEGKMYG